MLCFDFVQCPNASVVMIGCYSNNKTALKRLSDMEDAVDKCLDSQHETLKKHITEAKLYEDVPKRLMS